MRRISLVLLFILDLTLGALIFSVLPDSIQMGLVYFSLFVVWIGIGWLVIFTVIKLFFAMRRI